MTNQELESRFEYLVKEERRITREILELIREAERRRLHLERGFANLYDWLVKGYGYSQSAANRRIQAARLLRDVPAVSEKLSAGTLNLTTLTQVQGALKREEKRRGARMAPEQKAELVAKIEGKSSQETEKILVALFPEEKAKETLRAVSETESKLQLVLDDEALANLQRAKELLSHVLPGASWSELVAHLAKDFVKRKDPLKKTAAVNPCVIKRAQGRCEYRDPKTNRLCGGGYQIEVDHIHPKALGGIDDPANLRALCRAHNIFEAERVFGRRFMDRWKTNSS